MIPAAVAGTLGGLVAGAALGVLGLASFGYHWEPQPKEESTTPTGMSGPAMMGMPGGGPVRAGVAVADVGAGLHCAIGCLIVLLERESSGQGQWISTSLLQAMISICDFQAARWTIAHDVPVAFRLETLSP